MAIYLAPVLANDGPVDGLILPKEISCCSEEEALTIQHKLDVVISELRQIKDILCRHKETVPQASPSQSQAPSPASTSSRAGSGELEMATFKTSVSAAPSSSSINVLPVMDESKPLLLRQ